MFEQAYGCHGFQIFRIVGDERQAVMQRGRRDDGFGVRERRFALPAQFHEICRAPRNLFIDGVRNERRQKVERLFLILWLDQEPEFQMGPRRGVQVALGGELLRGCQSFGNSTQAANQNIRVKQIVTHVAPSVAVAPLD